MHFLKLVFRNIFRHKLRSFLTMLGLVVAILAFGLLQTVVDAWYAGADMPSQVRMNTSESKSRRSGVGRERQTSAMRVGPDAAGRSRRILRTTSSVIPASAIDRRSPSRTPVSTPDEAITKPPIVGATRMGSRRRIA